MSGKKFLVYDFSLFTEHAAKLAQDGECYYYTQWESGFPDYSKYIIGEGSGVKKITNFWDYVDEVDCIVNFDVYNNDIIAFLRDKGYRCFGSGHGEILENDRWKQKQLLKKIGLPVNDSVKIKGIPDLRDHLQKNKDKYVKIDLFRKNLESFHSKDFKSSELILNEMENTLGPFNDQFNFIVEDAIDAEESVEPGCDLFFNGKEFVKPYLYGYELSKALYIGKFVNELPKQLQNTVDKFTPVMQKLDYRGAFSTEEKVVSKDKSYLLDICSRMPAPLSAGYVEWIKNFTDLIWKVSGKEDVKIDPIATYVGAMPLTCSHANENWVRLILDDEKNRKNVKFRQFTKKDGFYYAVPGLDEVVVLVAWGNSVDEVCKKLDDLTKTVEAYSLQSDISGDLVKIKEEIDRGKKLGIDF